MKELIEQQVVVADENQYVMPHPSIRRRFHQTAKQPVKNVIVGGQLKVVASVNRPELKGVLLRQIQAQRNLGGSKLSDFTRLLPQVSVDRIKKLLAEMRSSGVIRLEGKTRAGRWIPAENQVQLELPLDPSE